MKTSGDFAGPSSGVMTNISTTPDGVASERSLSAEDAVSSYLNLLSVLLFCGNASHLIYGAKPHKMCPLSNLEPHIPMIYTKFKLLVIYIELNST
jgi:hypothetical protein